MFKNLFKHVFSNPLKKEGWERPSGVRTVELTIVRFTPGPTPTTNTFSSGQAAASWLGIPTDAEYFIEASVHQDNVSLGDFLLWCSGEYARARIGEHREHDASHPDSSFTTSKTITFKDEDGSIFNESGEVVLLRGLAIDALRAWLIDLKHPSFLRWS